MERTHEERLALLDAIKDRLPEKVYDFLKNSGFMTAPASTKFHGAYDGGLFDHSFAVMEALMSLTEMFNLKWQNERSPILVGICHDLCKYDQYTKTNTAGFGQYSWNAFTRLKGHGDKSVALLKELIDDLTKEEELCIRWHMGAFDVKENWTLYTEAIKMYPTVLWTHTADMMASNIKGV